MDKIKEPAWHRNLRKLRQKDRGVLAATNLGLLQPSSFARAAVRRLSNHHGSSPGKAMSGWEKPDWHCKSCKGADHKPYRNKGFRAECRICRIGKGACFGGNVAASGPPTKRTLADRQIAGEKAAKRQQGTKRQSMLSEREKEKQLLHKVEALEKQLADAGIDKKDASEEPIAEKQRIAELERWKSLYAQLPGEEAKVKEMDEQIKTIKGARAAAIPCGEQLRRAEQTLAKKTKKFAALEQEEAEAQKKLAELQEKRAAAKVEREQAEDELQKVKNALQSPTPIGKDRSVDWGSIAQGCKDWCRVVPPELLEQYQLGSDSLESLCSMLSRMSACGEAAKAKQAEKEAQPAQGQEAAPPTATSSNGSPLPAGDEVMPDAGSKAKGGSIDEQLAKLCSTDNPEDKAAVDRCRELLAGKGARRTSPY